MDTGGGVSELPESKAEMVCLLCKISKKIGRGCEV